MREEKLNEEKKRLLIDSAVREFAERGFDGASYNKIIERSGLSKGTVYYYFENKESLLKMVLNDICERFSTISDGLKLPRTEEEFWKVDSEYHRRAVNFILENSCSHVLYIIFSGDARISAMMSDISGEMLAFRYALIVRGQELGVVRDDLSVKTISLIIQEIGKVLSASMIGENKSGEADEAKMQQKIKNFVEMIRDLSFRILTPS